MSHIGDLGYMYSVLHLEIESLKILKREEKYN